MNPLADRITEELQVLIGEPISGCWRAANMQIFEFGPPRKYLNRKGEELEGANLKLHVQCRWRMVDATRILFGRDDLLRPANAGIAIEDFDWDEDESPLDVLPCEWFAEHRNPPVHVVQATGDIYGGCRIELEEGFLLQLFPCDSRRSEYSEHWRFFRQMGDQSHFVITGDGVLQDLESS
jgi:hypothetical protein